MSNWRVCGYCALLGAPALLAAEEARVLPVVTVTAAADGEEARHAAVTQKTVLERAELEALGGLSVGEVIRKLPGIEAGAHSGDGGPSANARGMGRDAVQFLVDGERPSANARYALTTVGRLPAGELERVEILRGASAEHGGAAPVTVNLVMRRARQQAAGSTLKAAGGVRGEAANGQFTLSQSGGDKQFSWVLPLTLNHHAMPLQKTLYRTASDAGGALSGQTEREHSPYTLNELIVSPRLNWRGERGSFSLWPSLYHNEGQRRADLVRTQEYAPGALADASRSERETSRLTIGRLRAEGETRTDWGKLSGRVALMGAARHQETDRQWRSALGGQTLAREAIERDEREFSAALRLDRPVGEGLISSGLEQSVHRRDERQRVSGSAPASGEYDARAVQWAAWWQHEWPLARALTLTYGLRGEQVALAAQTQRQSDAALLPSLAARLELVPGLIVRSSLGAGLKTPKLDEISALTVRTAGVNTPLEADRGGNPSLKAERNLNWELAVDRHLPGEAGTLGANVYLRRTEAFIERRARLESGRWVERPENVGLAHHWGLELDAKLQGALLGLKGASLRSHLTLPQARVADERQGGTRDARDLPRYQWSLALDQSLPAWQSSAGFQLNVYGATRTDIPGELASAQRARTLFDLYLVRRLSPQLNVRLEAQNVLGADTRRLARAMSGGSDWSLTSTERGQRTFMLSLEGKW